MLFQVFILSVIILAPALLGIGIKLLFNKQARLPAGSCQASFDSDNQLICGCGSGLCKAGDKIE